MQQFRPHGTGFQPVLAGSGPPASTPVPSLPRWLWILVLILILILILVFFLRKKAA